MHFELSRLLVAGSISDISSAYLRLEIETDDVRCSDSALYRCEMVYQLMNASFVSSTSEAFVMVSGRTDSAHYSCEMVSGKADSAHYRCVMVSGIQTPPTIGVRWCQVRQTPPTTGVRWCQVRQTPPTTGVRWCQVDSS